MPRFEALVHFPRVPLEQDEHYVPNFDKLIPPGHTPTRLLVVDGLSVLFRAHHAQINRPLLRSDGRNVSGLAGFVNTLKRACDDVKPTHILVAMDTPASKGQRRAMDQV